MLDKKQCASKLVQSFLSEVSGRFFSTEHSDAPSCLCHFKILVSHLPPSKCSYKKKHSQVSRGEFYPDLCGSTFVSKRS